METGARAVVTTTKAKVAYSSSHSSRGAGGLVALASLFNFSEMHVWGPTTDLWNHGIWGGLSNLVYHMLFELVVYVEL